MRWAILGLSAIGSALAHPPLGWWWLALVAPAPLFALLSGKRARTGFLYGWWWGFVYALVLGFPLTYLVNLRTGSWWLSAVGWVGIAALGALFWGLFGTVAARMPASGWGWLGMAGLWTLCQWLRGLGPFAFVWGHLSVSLYRAPVLIQIADLMGVWGLEFLLALVNALLGACFLKALSPTGGKGMGEGAKYPLVALALTLLIWLGYGVWRWAHWSAPALQGEAFRFAIIQPNLDLTRAYTPREWAPIRARLAELVRQAAGDRPQLIILPESVEPYPMPEVEWAFEFWRQLAGQTQTPILVGGYRIADPITRQYANTTHLFLPDGTWRYHDKVQLVPLGEHVPFREQLPFLEAFGVVERDLIPGDSLEPIRMEPLRIGAVICMESTYPWIARLMVRNGANLIVVLSNESWFGRTAALEQHLAYSVLRAVETRRFVVRSAPQGVSAVIAPSGRVQRVPAFQEAVVPYTVQLLSVPTLYERWGDWIVSVSAILALWGWFRGVRSPAGRVSSARPEAT